jgi:hypothetical protein
MYKHPFRPPLVWFWHAVHSVGHTRGAQAAQSVLAVAPQQVFAVEPRHKLETQSPATRQVWLSVHLLQVPPPQSTSVSVRFLCASVQDGWVQVRLGPQIVLTQSASWAQPLPSAHFWGVASARQGPPQSASVSPPFLVWSEQVGAAHVPPLQTPLTQLLAILHVRFTAHFAQVTPFGSAPQSVSPSRPFLMPSWQVGTWQNLGLPSHTPLMQSRAKLQVTPSAQGPQTAPPQLMPVSSPFWTVSLQV